MSTYDLDLLRTMVGEIKRGRAAFLLAWRALSDEQREEVAVLGMSWTAGWMEVMGAGHEEARVDVLHELGRVREREQSPTPDMTEEELVLHVAKLRAEREAKEARRALAAERRAAP